jgi:tryptophanyl-tRNA synthetase
MVTVNDRVVSGMRPTGRLHLGHLHGALNNWIELQYEYDCFFFIVDWHALTTHYEDPRELRRYINEVATDWLAAGLDPASAHLFVQSMVPEHAELHLLLSMITPLGWLERVPTYKEQQEKLKDKDLSTYGFLGYPVLQSSDILIYRGTHVPVGEDQAAHVEMTREIARRFNHIYGRGADYEEKMTAAVRALGKKLARQYQEYAKVYQESGDDSALSKGRELVEAHASLTKADRERLLGGLEGSGRSILVEPKVLLTETPKLPGTDGQKMSKSYGNVIELREDEDSVSQKVKTMQTDPARVRRTDPGTPEACPVWDLHKVYSDADTQAWVREGCTSAGIGCLDCKGRVIDRIQEELQPIRRRGEEYASHPEEVERILEQGAESAREVARETMEDVRQAMGLPKR